MSADWRIGSLFAGIGGLELGLEWAGCGRTVWQVEREPYAAAILARHWPAAERFDDVRSVGASNLAPVDIICGGFPCQDLSYAGKGAGLDGERSGLWREFARIVGEIRPRFVVVENVSALLGRGVGRVLGDLAALGYDALWIDLRASDLGAPHRRERLFIVGWRSVRGGRRADQRVARAAFGAGLADGDDARRDKRGRARGIGGGWAEPTDGGGRLTQSRVGRIADGIPPGMDRWPARPGEAQHPWEPPRVAQGIPHRAARLKALGNAVVPQVAYVVGRILLQVAERP